MLSYLYVDEKIFSLTPFESFFFFLAFVVFVSDGTKFEYLVFEPSVSRLQNALHASDPSSIRDLVTRDTRYANTRSSESVFAIGHRYGDNTDQSCALLVLESVCISRKRFTIGGRRTSFHSTRCMNDELGKEIIPRTRH